MTTEPNEVWCSKCDRPAVIDGYCSDHYLVKCELKRHRQWGRHSHPNMAEYQQALVAERRR